MQKPNPFFVIIFLTIFLLSGCDDSLTKVEDEPTDQPDPQVQSVIDRTNLDTLMQFVSELSGEVCAVVNGDSCFITSRHKNYPGNDIAADYFYQTLDRYGLLVHNQYVTPSCRNVYAIQIGATHPDQKYIICAHYDNMPEDSLAPGADDNASGTAAVLEAARILSQFSSDYTIIYALWDEEEQGIVGSAGFAQWSRVNNENILGVINIDMIGWDSDNDGKFWINTVDTANSVAIANQAVKVNQLYQVGLAPQVLNPGSGSDNLPFWHFGYSAIGMEEMYGSDWNAFYHTPEDKLEHFNLPYFHKCAQIAIGTLASLTRVKLLI